MTISALEPTIQARLEEFATAFDRRLSELFTAARGVPPRLAESAAYSALLPGKRLRPYLTTRCGALCGADEHATLPAALAVECVHAFSLVHDDLPAMDDDDLRRGRPTNHKVYGEAMAILAGDALVTLAFEVLATRARSPEVAAKWCAELAAAAGWAGMIGGQVLDLDGEQQAPTAETVARIHESKTARLIQCACRLGAIAAGADETRYRAVSDFGRQLGLAFQIADDVLDEVGQAERIGKNVGKDQHAGKQTYCRVVGVERARALAREHVARAVEALSPFAADADDLRALAQYVVERDR